MESQQLASWQFVDSFPNPHELSPPISPSPPSPTLYANAYGGGRATTPIDSKVSRAQLASNILRELEAEQFQNVDEEMLWTEESVNLELFDDLDDFEDFGRPLTPDSQEFQNQEHLLQLDGSPVPSPSSSSSSEFPSDSYDDLSAEFQNILNGLSAQVTTINDGEVIQILGLDEIQGYTLGMNEEFDNKEDESDENAEEDMDEEDESHTFDDFELQLIGLSDQTTTIPSPSSSTSSILSNEDIQPSQINCEGILDALLQGDLESAKALIPPNSQPMAEIILVTTPSASSSSTSTRPRRSSTINLKKHAKIEEKKTQSGRVGGTGVKKPRLPKSTDKVQRKKEQNKTAATRYREKKKLEAAIVSVQEDELEKINIKLTGERDNLHRQVLIYKELLREVFADRKSKKSQEIARSSGVGGARKR